TRAYLLSNPEVLPEAMDVLQQRELVARIEPLRNDLEAPFPGAVLGNPSGSVTLVEFSDYACTYCRQSRDDVDALIAANPDLKVVIREYPILRPESLDAARMALAAAQQGKYAAFHDAMFRLGPPSAETIEAAARQAGVDLALARATIGSGARDVRAGQRREVQPGPAGGGDYGGRGQGGGSRARARPGHDRQRRARRAAPRQRRAGEPARHHGHSGVGRGRPVVQRRRRSGDDR